MFWTIAIIVIITVLVLLALLILPYAIFITFFPLVRTLGGGVNVLKAYSAKKKRERTPKEKAR